MINTSKLKKLYESCVRYPYSIYRPSEEELLKFCKKVVMLAENVDDLIQTLEFTYSECRLKDVETHIFILCTLREEFFNRIEQERQ